MAAITIQVQSLLNSGGTLTINTNTANTVQSVIDQVVAQESLPANIVALTLDGVTLDPAATLAAEGVTNQAKLGSYNTISVFQPQQDRRDLKLFLAQTKRRSVGTQGFRLLNTYIPPGRTSAGAGSEGHPWELPNLVAPSNLVGVFSQPDQVDLDWTNLSTTDIQVRVYRSQDPMDLQDVNNMPAPLAVLPSGSNSFVDTVPTVGPDYFYRVSVFDGINELFSDVALVEVGSVIQRDGKFVLDRFVRQVINAR